MEVQVHLSIFLNTMVASLTASCLIIGSHCNCLRIGVTWSNFLVPETIRAAKFCTACNSSVFFLVVLAHTDEQYNNLLNTRESSTYVSYQTDILRDLFDKVYLYISKLLELHVRRKLDYSPL